MTSSSDATTSAHACVDELSASGAAIAGHAPSTVLELGGATMIATATSVSRTATLDGLCHLVDDPGTHALSPDQAETMLTAPPGVEIHTS